MSWIQSDFQYSEPAYTPPTWADGTDAEIIEALEKHYAGEINLHDYWSVGDERTISLSAMSAYSGLGDTHLAQDVTFVITEIGGKLLSDGVTECAFQVDQKMAFTYNSQKGGTVETGKINPSTNTNWKNCQRRGWCNSTYYNAIPETIRPIFKEFINQSGKGGTSTSGTYDTNDYFALRAEIEVTGNATYSVTGEGTQIEWYKTSSNRIKNHIQIQNGQTTILTITWWLRSSHRGNYQYFVKIQPDGTSLNEALTNNRGLAPFGVI